MRFKDARFFYESNAIVTEQPKTTARQLFLGGCFFWLCAIPIFGSFLGGLAIHFLGFALGKSGWFGILVSITALISIVRAALGSRWSLYAVGVQQLIVAATTTYFTLSIALRPLTPEPWNPVLSTMQIVLITGIGTTLAFLHLLFAIVLLFSRSVHSYIVYMKG